MATTAIWNVTDRLDRVIDYATNPQKTENLDFSSPDFWGLHNVLTYTQQDAKTEKQIYVSGVNCDPATACQQMNRIKLQFQKTDGILAFHGYQAFAPRETTPETAHAVGMKLAQELWGDRFEVVVSTHLDKEHLHNHFVLNSVSFMDGKRYYDNKATYALMRKTSDRLCREYSLSVIENPKRGKSKHYAEWKAEHENKTTVRLHTGDPSIYGAIKEQMKEFEKRKRYTSDTIDKNSDNLIAKENVEYEVLASESKIELYQRIQSLDETTREVMYLRFTGDLSFREIGDILKKNETWARVTFYRGKQKLMKEGQK